MENYYKLLDVSPIADLDLIRKAFRKKAKSCHPDLFQKLPQEEQQKRQKEFVRLTQAYEILADPKKRQLFDRQLAKTSTKAPYPHDQKNRRSSSFSYGRSSFKRKKENSMNAQNSSTSNPEDTLEDLLKEVEEMLKKFGLKINIYDEKGQKLIDGPGGMWCVQIGYGRKEMAEAIADQIIKIPYYSPWNMSASPSALLARKIAERAPSDLKHVFFTTCGSTAVDTAIRFVHFYNNVRGKPQKKLIKEWQIQPLKD